ncbi:MAG: hypothetical protein M1827_005550 [Pycnora praestabilis]|nr:MAG: hypothetical protein M1827_005550 [Pycnora praestabilis]
MARTSKFSFPLPGRKSATTKKKSLNTSLVTDVLCTVGAGTNGGSSKAQRILGTLDPPAIAPTKKAKNRRGENGLDKKDSFRSVCVSEVNLVVASGGHDGTGSKVATTGTTRPAILPRPSSPLLGQRYRHNSADPSVEDLSRKSHYSGSSSTLRSYYDPQKSPLSVSQQTSASSSRDMALRKGYPTVAEPIELSTSLETTTNLNGTSGHVQAPSGFSKTQPPRLDISMLFPKPQTSGKGTLLSPSTLVHSPSPASQAAGGPQLHESTDLKVRKWGGLRNVMSKDAVKDGNKRSSAGVPQSHTRVSANQSTDFNDKPLAVDKNWFDGIEEDTDTVSSAYDLSEPIAIPREPEEKFDGGEIQNVMPPIPARHRPTLSDVSQENEHIAHDLSLQPSLSQSHINNQNRPSLQPWAATSSCSLSSRMTGVSKKSTNSVLSNSDLYHQSVLVLSSSDDEDSDHEAGLDTSLIKAVSSDKDRPNDYFTHRTTQLPIVRQVPDTDQEYSSVQNHKSRTSGKSNGTRPVQNNTYSNGTDSLPLSEQKQDDKQVLNNPQRPSKARGVTERPKTSTATSSGNKDSWIDHDLPPSSPSRSESRLQTRHSRIMAVSKEEEALIEAMRYKRASMQQSSFAEGYLTAITQDTKRSTTAVLTSPILNKHCTALRGSALSPAQPPRRKTSKAASRAATDFPDNTLPTSPKAKSSCDPAPFIPTPLLTSASLHFNATEYIQTRPTSRAEPITPPSSDETRKRSPTSNSERSHSRRRTASSGCLTSGGEDEPMTPEAEGEEDELAVWGLRSYLNMNNVSYDQWKGNRGMSMI